MSGIFTSVGGFASFGLFAEVMDTVWFKLAVVIIAALTSWFHRRKKKRAGQAEPWGGEDDENYRPQRPGGGSTSAPNPNQPLNWEEELKRLLEGQPPLDSTAGTPPPPPPVIRRETPPPPPLPVSVARESLPTDHEGKPSRESAATPWQDVSLDSQPQPARPLATLEQSTHAYQRAAQLQESVAARMQRVDEQTEKHGKPLAASRLTRQGSGSPDARAVVALLRRPATARQALLASFVLAPPKALEN